MCSRLLHHSNDVRYCIPHFLFLLPYTSFNPTACAPWRWCRVVHYKTLVLNTQYPRGCWIQEGTRYTPRRTTTVESENGLRKIWFVQKIDWESCREGLLFVRSIIGEIFGGNVAFKFVPPAHMASSCRFDTTWLRAVLSYLDYAQLITGSKMAPISWLFIMMLLL